MSNPPDAYIEIALDVLMWLSENSDDGRLRDDIGYVRHVLHEELDKR